MAVVPEAFSGDALTVRSALRRVSARLPGIGMINHYKLRLLVPAPLKSLLREASCLPLFSDWNSAMSYYRLNRGSRGHAVPGMTKLRMRQLKHAAIHVRPDTTDARVVFSTFVHRFHLPPAGVLRNGPAVILDLGANIGCTMAHLACMYPQADLCGVELDAENAELCRRNIDPWKDRCKLIEGAVWKDDGEVQYEHRMGAEDGFSARPVSSESPTGTRTARAYSLNTLIATVCRPGQVVDYVKMDIEGAERDVLQCNTEWAARVRSIKIELHGDYSKEDCVRDLQRLGFKAWADNNHAACAVGVRDM